jgi:CheY-like chemotaxis protein
MKILMVDDDAFFRKFYASKLVAEGYQVDTAANGREALDYLARAKPDILLLDLIMPQMDGFEVLKELTKVPGTKPPFPIIVFSTLSQPQDVERAKQLGASDFVNKVSLNFTVLIEKIRTFAKGQTL